MKRRYISWKTKCAATLAALEALRRPGLTYDEIKILGEKRFLKRWHFDHNILHETGHKDRDKFWNLTPMFVAQHREKTKQDAKIIAKSRRIRKRLYPVPDKNEPTEAERFSQRWAAYVRGTKPKRKISSRGFDKSRRRKMSGKVVKRER